MRDSEDYHLFFYVFHTVEKFISTKSLGLELICFAECDFFIFPYEVKLKFKLGDES